LQPSKKVLVSDGDPIVLAIICYILQRQGYEATPIAERQDLLRIIRDGHYDAMVVDAVLEGVVDVVKSTRPRASRIILTTLSGEEADLGVHATLCKPLEFDVLIDAVRRCVEQAAVTVAPRCEPARK